MSPADDLEAARDTDRVLGVETEPARPGKGVIERGISIGQQGGGESRRRLARAQQSGPLASG
ncbi:hypothetical protein AB0L71_25105 [Streptomyces sp. NPDC052052]|uniref:hypothetical protein n=1 Tax=Streptomyces sp. NPDC052052 TaxID=3154756 RepID=UPI0034215A61